MFGRSAPTVTCQKANATGEDVLRRISPPAIRWPEDYEVLLARLRDRMGHNRGTREFVGPEVKPNRHSPRVSCLTSPVSRLHGHLIGFFKVRPPI